MLGLGTNTDAPVVVLVVVVEVDVVSSCAVTKTNNTIKSIYFKHLRLIQKFNI